MAGGRRRCAAAAMAAHRLSPLAASLVLLLLAALEPVRALGFEVLDGGSYLCTHALLTASPAAKHECVAGSSATWQCGRHRGFVVLPVAAAWPAARRRAVMFSLGIVHGGLLLLPEQRACLHVSLDVTANLGAHKLLARLALACVPPLCPSAEQKVAAGRRIKQAHWQQLGTRWEMKPDAWSGPALPLAACSRGDGSHAGAAGRAVPQCRPLGGPNPRMERAQP